MNQWYLEAASSVVAMVLFATSCTTDAPTGVRSQQPEGDIARVDTVEPNMDAAASAEDVVGGSTGFEPVQAQWPDCQDARTPIVMVHGAFASGDTWAPHARRFMANGYCPQHLFTFDYNSTLGPESAVDDLDAFITDVLTSTGVVQVDLMGHSMGGGVSYAYLGSSDRAKRVRRYVHVGSTPAESVASSEVPMLNLASKNDPIVPGNTGIPNAENVILEEEDHYAVATSDASFEAIYMFLNDAPPRGERPHDSAGSALVAGRAVTFGENTPLAGGTLQLWRVHPDTAARTTEEPALTLTVESNGRFGPIAVEPGATYEWVVQGQGEGQKPIHYYREPVKSSNAFLYLRSLPAPNTLVGSLLAGVTFNDRSASLVVFSESQAVLAGRDSLTVDGEELLNEDTASRENSTIALFLYDENGNDASDSTPVELFGAFPFFAGVDIFRSAMPVDTVSYSYNGRTLAVRSLPGASGAVVAVFD